MILNIINSYNPYKRENQLIGNKSKNNYLKQNINHMNMINKANSSILIH